MALRRAPPSGQPAGRPACARSKWVSTYWRARCPICRPVSGCCARLEQRGSHGGGVAGGNRDARAGGFDHLADDAIDRQHHRAPGSQVIEYLVGVGGLVQLDRLEDGDAGIRRGQCGGHFGLGYRRQEVHVGSDPVACACASRLGFSLPSPSRTKTISGWSSSCCAACSTTPRSLDIPWAPAYRAMNLPSRSCCWRKACPSSCGSNMAVSAPLGTSSTRFAPALAHVLDVAGGVDHHHLRPAGTGSAPAIRTGG